MEQLSNDDVSLESTVLTAMMRLQSGKTSCKKQRTCDGVSCEAVVKYLKSNVSWLDGDIESQVMTTLLSCVKTGLICALDCGKFRFIQPSSKNMVTNCLTRISHGPNCTCLKMLKNMVKTFRRPCCVLKGGRPTVSRGRKVGGKKSSRKSKMSRWGSCALKAQEQLGSTSTVFKANGKCNYCLEFHSPPKTKNVCSNCNCLESISGVPSDKFSPRDESSERFCDSWK